LGWDRIGNYNLDKFQNEMKSNPGHISKTAVKILTVRAPFNRESLISYLPMVIYFPLFWIWVFLNLCKSRPKVIHACDLDAVLPCYFYKTLFRSKLVFDVFDRYAMTLIPPKFKALHSIVNLFEEFFSKHSDVLINISEEVLLTFRNKPRHCVLIMNCPDDYWISKQKSKKDNLLTVVYTGAIWKKTRGLENIIAAIKDVANVELVLAGWYRHKEFLDEILQVPNVKYRGLLQPNEALALEASADVIIALYQPELLLYSVTLPNKLFEAMMCGVPLITNVASKVVNEVEFGIIVEYDNIEEIKKAIVRLRDNTTLRHRLGLNGRKAYLEKYSWSKMEQELFNVYATLQD
jgi:glycosyltransferase involved in cell wall biosynthesis